MTDKTRDTLEDIVPAGTSFRAKLSKISGNS
jgi:hypothetical protein